MTSKKILNQSNKGVRALLMNRVELTWEFFVIAALDSVQRVRIDPKNYGLVSHQSIVPFRIAPAWPEPDPSKYSDGLTAEHPLKASL